MDLYLGEIVEELQRLLHGHIQHFGDVLALELDLQRFAVIAFALADLAGHGDIGQELHLDLDIAFAAAGFAAAALDVEGKAPGTVAPHPGFRHGGEQARGWG